MSTDDILDAIDHALRDVSLSADAMRWTPDTVPEDAKDPSGRHATDVLVGREERPVLDERRAREARAHAGEPLSDPHRYARSIGCTCFDTLADVCPRHPGVTANDMARTFVARAFGVPDVPACACPDGGHVPTCIMRRVSHESPSRLAEHVERTRQGRLSERTEGARATLSIQDELARWMNDPRSPVARAGHDFTCAPEDCPGCRSLSALIRQDPHGGQTHRDLLARFMRWGREHDYALNQMQRHDIPPRRAGDPLPYYRALWRNARTQLREPMDPVPYVRLGMREQGRIPVLLLGGHVPYDGSVLYVERIHDVINVSADVLSRLDALSIVDPVGSALHIDQYVGHRFRHPRRGGWDEVVYLCGVSGEYAQPIVNEAIHRRLIGPLARER